MKKHLVLLAVLLVLAVCAGCATTATPEAVPPEESQPETQREVLTLDEDTRGKYFDFLWQPLWNGHLTFSWEGTPEAYKNPNGTGSTFDIKKIELEKGAVTGEITAYAYLDIYGERYIDPVTKEEWPHYTGENIIVQPQQRGNDFFPYIKQGESVVTIKNPLSDKAELVKCEHTAYEAPATAALKAATEELKAELEASQKVVDVVESYDPYLLQVLYCKVLSSRWIEQPEDVTLYDLEHIHELDISWSTMGIYPDEMENGANYKMDAGLLRYTPNLEFLTVGPELQDYSVFEDMTQLVEMTINMEAWWDEENGERTPDLSSLKIGKAANLTLDAFRSDIVVDLTNCDVNNLKVNSWVAAVTEFKGCENLRGFTMYGTRSDTSIISAETFPNAKRITLEFYSDYARFRNLANLGTFGDDVFIELKLDYQAANNKTVATLDGVRIDHLTLDPANGPWVLPEPDPELVGKIKVIPTNVTWLSNPAPKTAEPTEE